MRVRLSLNAQLDLVDIGDYYTKEANIMVAERVVNKISRDIRPLRDFPEIGRRRPELELNVSPVRVLISGNYLCFYTVTESEVIVLRVLHTARNITSGLLGLGEEE